MKITINEISSSPSGWSALNFSVLLDGKLLCWITRYTANCSIAILTSIAGLNNEEIKAIVDRLFTNYIADTDLSPGCRLIYNGTATCIQCTTNSISCRDRFIACGFEVIQEYTSLGSGKTIYVMSILNHKCYGGKK